VDEVASDVVGRDWLNVVGRHEGLQIGFVYRIYGPVVDCVFVGFRIW
jgi:hypothetical protein